MEVFFFAGAGNAFDAVVENECDWCHCGFLMAEISLARMFREHRWREGRGGIVRDTIDIQLSYSGVSSSTEARGWKKWMTKDWLVLVLVKADDSPIFTTSQLFSYASGSRELYSYRVQQAWHLPKFTTFSTIPSLTIPSLLTARHSPLPAKIMSSFTLALVQALS